MYLSIFKIHGPAQLEEEIKEMGLISNWFLSVLERSEMYVQIAMTCTQEDYIILHCTKPVCYPLTLGVISKRTPVFSSRVAWVLYHTPLQLLLETAATVWEMDGL